MGKSQAYALEALETAESALPDPHLCSHGGRSDLGQNRFLGAGPGNAEGAAERAREMGFIKCLAYAYQSLAHLYFLHGDLEEARVHSQGSNHLCEDQ